MVRTEDGSIACICHEHRPECDCESRSEAPDLHWQLLPTYLKQLARYVPNRLYGVTINNEGDAV